MPNIKRRDGFEGEKLISLPDSVWKKAIKQNPVLEQLYVTHIGYFPRASNHYRERKNGCADNILLYCLRGKGWYKIKNKLFEVQVNEFVIIPATKENLSYGADKDDPWTIYWVHFSGRDMAMFNRSFNIGPFDGPQGITFNEKGIQLWNSMYQNLSMGFSTENLNSTNLCLYHFVSAFLYPEQPVSEKKKDTRNMINDTIMYMRNNLHEKLTVDDMAEQNNLSVSHFSFLFRKATGMPPLDYFIHLKLQQACLLLFSTDKKIRTIAEELGYNDPYYFSRLFKKYMKSSPEIYRVTQTEQGIGKI